MASGQMDIGKLMVTSDLQYWSDYGNRNYVAIIDMSNVPRNAYYQVNRGFGNEFFVTNPSKAKVIAVLPKNKAFSKNREQNQYLPGSEAELLNFYNSVVK
jgi:hypothetical protein